MAVIAFGILGALASIPKEVWLAVLTIAAVLGAIHLVRAQTVSNPRAEVVPPARAGDTRLAERKIHESEDSRRQPEQAEGFRLPNAPPEYGPAKWIPSEQSVEVAGRNLSGGMIYVGTSLPTPLGNPDPCLIDPSKPVARQGDFTQSEMGYWPSYSDVSPLARAAYLDWLADGRRHPEADVGYVFLFFYGLERRAILDADTDPEAQKDLPHIAQELRELLAVYGLRSGSFRRYAGELLNWVETAGHPARLYESPIPEFPRTYELPLYLRLALGQAAAAGAPVPAHVALAWARLAPEVSLRTPARRCGDEFERLFAEKYERAFGQGMIIPRNRTKLRFVYRPASAGFRGFKEPVLTFGGIHDVTVLTAPIRKLAAVVEEATVPLEAFSRHLKRNPSDRNSLAALLYLPVTLWPPERRGALARLKGRVGEGMIALPCKELLETLGATSELTSDRFTNLARALISLNIAIEPDILGGAKVPKAPDRIVLFWHPGSESSRTPAYRAALLTLQLSSAVAMADGDFGAAEIIHLRQEIQSWAHLTESHQRRLIAHLRLLTTTPVTLGMLRKKLGPLEPKDKESIAIFMASVAQSDGVVSPAEVKMLEKVYKALGVEPKKVFSDVHAVTAGASTAPEERAETTGFILDSAKIDALHRDSVQVASLLADIFKGDDDTGSGVATEPEEEDEARAALLGLDEAHEAFARMVLTRPRWSREELIEVAADLELMLDGALEHVNEASFDVFGAPFTEGEETLEVNLEVLEAMEQ